jgi:hypothetical protein
MLKTCFDQSPYYTLARDFYENEPLKLRTLRKTLAGMVPGSRHSPFMRGSSERCLMVAG